MEIVEEEENEKEEKLPPVEESQEAVRKRKQQEFITKQSELLQFEVSFVERYGVPLFFGWQSETDLFTELK